MTPKMKAKTWVSEKTSERREDFKMCEQGGDLAQLIERLLSVQGPWFNLYLTVYIIGSGGPQAESQH